MTDETQSEDPAVVADEEIPEEVLDEVLDAEELPGDPPPSSEDLEHNTGVPPGKPIDAQRLIAVAQKRYDRGVSRGRKDMDTTFSAWVLNLAEEIGAERDAYRATLRSEASRRLAAMDARGIGPVARSYLLAAKLERGDFDA